MSRILIANENPSTTAFLKTTLKKAGHKAVAVDNGLEARRESTKTEFDIFLIDVSMPGIDYFVIAQKALQENPLMQIIFITGFAGVAMDTYATPSYAPAPVTTQAFHLKDINARIRALQNGAFYEHDGSSVNSATSGQVIYADFGRMSFAGADQASL